MLKESGNPKQRQGMYIQFVVIVKNCFLPGNLDHRLIFVGLSPGDNKRFVFSL